MSPSQVNALWQWYAQRGDRLISDIRPKFREVLNPEDRSLEKSIDYEIKITGNTNAFSLPNGQTIITSSFLQIIDSMATVMAAAQAFNTPECLGSYVEYLGEGTRNNSWLVAHGRQPQPVAMAFGYWQLRKDICGGLTESKFRGNQKADDLRELLINASLVYLIGHEFCHHKFRDNTFRMVSPEERDRERARGIDVSHEVTPNEQVTKERRADLFGFRKMIEMDYPPVAAMPVLVFFLGVEGFSPEMLGTDHPAAAVRFEDMVRETENDSEFKSLINGHHLQSQWDAFKALSKQFGQTSQTNSMQSSMQSRPVGSFAGQSDQRGLSDGECGDLTDYVNSAAHRFVSLKGSVEDRDSTGITYRTKHGVAGFKDCEIDFYSDPGLQPSAVCDIDGGDFDDISKTLEACFPIWNPRQKSLASGEEYELSGPNGVKVRLRASANHIRLWVDSPD
jgi:hypothetical protein